MKNLLLILSLLVLVSCGSKQPAPPYTPDPVDPISDTLCERVCIRYESLGCSEAKPTPEGHLCVEICDNLLDSMIPGVEAYYKCVAVSASCEKSRECE